MRGFRGVRAVVPVRIEGALPRFAGPAPMRRQLAIAMLHDTIVAIRRCRTVGETVVVSPDTEAVALAESLGAKSVRVGRVEGGAEDLLGSAATAVDATCGLTATAVVMGDLPALTSAELTGVLGAARDLVAVRDLAEQSATILASCRGWPDLSGLAAPDRPLDHELLRHTPVHAPGAHADVDTVIGLRIADFLGVGEATHRLLKLPEYRRLMERAHVLAS